MKSGGVAVVPSMNIADGTTFRQRGNRIATKEFRELVQRSGITQNQFAAALGLAKGTMSNFMNGRSLPSLVVMNAARFVMLRLGHPVEIKPIDDAMFMKLPRRGCAKTGRR